MFLEVVHKIESTERVLRSGHGGAGLAMIEGWP